VLLLRKKTYHLIEEYFETEINLRDYDLEGCEFTEDDFRTIAVKWETSGKSLEKVVHEYLLSIREVLDNGLEDSDKFESVDEEGEK
jgi:hypothetical protein